jgi:hypothetical protein
MSLASSCQPVQKGSGKVPDWGGRRSVHRCSWRCYDLVAPPLLRLENRFCGVEKMGQR